jgi:hypothetical protein
LDDRDGTSKNTRFEIPLLSLPSRDLLITYVFF